MTKPGESPQKTNHNTQIEEIELAENQTVESNPEMSESPQMNSEKNREEDENAEVIEINNETPDSSIYKGQLNVMVKGTVSFFNE